MSLFLCFWALASPCAREDAAPAQFGASEPVLWLTACPARPLQGPVAWLRRGSPRGQHTCISRRSRSTRRHHARPVRSARRPGRADAARSRCHVARRAIASRAARLAARTAITIAPARCRGGVKRRTASRGTPCDHLDAPTPTFKAAGQRPQRRTPVALLLLLELRACNRRKPQRAAAPTRSSARDHEALSYVD